MPSFRDHLLTDEKLDEVLAKADPASKWIRDFVKSDNPKFKGKSKKERIKMALGAYYAKQRNEEVESVDEGARERLARMMQDKAMVKNPPKIPTPAERRAKEQEEKKSVKEDTKQIDEISQETKAAYTTKAKAQVKELQPFTKKKSEYRDLAKNLIAKRTVGIAKANEEVEENIDEAVVHDQYDQYNSMAAKKANDIINSLAKHKKAVYQGYPGRTDVMKEKGSRMHSGHVMHMKNLCRTLQDIHDELQTDVENNTPMAPQKVGK